MQKRWMSNKIATGAPLQNGYWRQGKGSGVFHPKKNGAKQALAFRFERYHGGA
jgi:hypothetical protein